MIKRILLLAVVGAFVDATERRGHHHHHHHSIKETLERMEKDMPQYSEKEKSALAKFENHKIFNEVWTASKNRLQERMREIEERRRRKHGTDYQ